MRRLYLLQSAFNHSARTGPLHLHCTANKQQYIDCSDMQREIISSVRNQWKTHRPSSPQVFWCLILKYLRLSETAEAKIWFQFLDKNRSVFRKTFASHAWATWKNSLGKSKKGTFLLNARFMFHIFSWKRTKKRDNCVVLERSEAYIRYCKSVRHTQTLHDFTA